MEKNITHCAVIYTQNVNAHQAIQSVLTNQKHFHQLHIIDPTRAEDDRLPEGFRIPVHYHGTLEPQHFPDNAIVTIIPPHACVKSGAFEMIERNMRASTVHQTHFGVTTTKRYNKFSIFHGFLVVMLLIEWIWEILDRSKIIQTTDIKSMFVLKKGNLKYFNEETTGWRFYNPHVIPKQYGGELAELVDAPMDHIFRNHRYMKLLGFWVFPFFWSWFTLGLVYVLVAYAQFRQPILLYVVTLAGLWIWEFMISFVITGYYAKMPYRIVFSLLFPVYFVLFPFYLIFQRI